MVRPLCRRSILTRLRLPEVPAGLGRAEPTRLCPHTSDIDLFGYGKGVVNLDAEISHCTFDFSMPKQ
jgi:hypothetical protein